MKHSILIAFIFSIAGCSSTGILKSGGDAYIVSKTSLQVGFGPPTAVHAEIVQEAEQFCLKQSKAMEVIRTDIQHPALGRPGSAAIEFRCAQKS
ncbi:MAG: hypothetical protein ABL869_03425 [Candidatus Nitrotoga sp.]